MRAPSRRISRVSTMCKLSAQSEDNLWSVEDRRTDTSIIKRLTKEDETGREGGDDDGITALPHDPVNDSDSQTSKDGGHAPHGAVGNVDSSLDVEVWVGDVGELKVAVEACEVACESEQHLGEWRVDIEIVLPLDVVGSELRQRYQQHEGQP